MAGGVRGVRGVGAAVAGRVPSVGRAAVAGWGFAGVVVGAWGRGGRALRALGGATPAPIAECSTVTAPRQGRLPASLRDGFATLDTVR
ncbi:hypothetical protein GCM10027097_31250 [Amycolatopsis acidiphila]